MVFHKALADKQVQVMKLKDMKHLDTVVSHEISILQSLNHKNIIKFYRALLYESQIYLFMEFCGCFCNI